MTDLSLVMGGDLTLGSAGDLATVSGNAWTQQRIIRRLLTIVGDYIWQLAYGAGLPQFVGSTVTEDQIAGIVRAQLASEASVLAAPAPTVTTTQDTTGDITATITYSTSSGPQTVTLSTAGGSISPTWTNWNPDTTPLS